MNATDKPSSGVYNGWTWDQTATLVSAYANNSLRVEGGEVVVYGYDKETRDVRFSGTPEQAEAFKLGACDAARVNRGWCDAFLDRRGLRGE